MNDKMNDIMNDKINDRMNNTGLLYNLIIEENIMGK